MHLISLVRLLNVSYEEGLRQQARFANLVKQAAAAGQSRHFLLLLEHSPVYTVGIRSNTVTQEEESRLVAVGAHFHRTSRGGLITFHGPGQLVAYPICGLRSLREEKGVGKVLGARKYVENLEESIIRTAASFGVRGVNRVQGLPGVWVDGRRKIASIGVSIQQGITGHGLALNCNNDLKWFHQIVACGIKDVEVTTLSKESRSEITVDETIPRLVSAFCDVFSLDADEFAEDDDKNKASGCSL